MNLLTTKETARLVRRPEGTLRRWRATGKGPPGYKLEGQWAYIEDEVIEWILVGIRLTHQAAIPSMRGWKTILGT